MHLFDLITSKISSDSGGFQRIIETALLLLVLLLFLLLLLLFTLSTLLTRPSPFLTPDEWTTDPRTGKQYKILWLPYGRSYDHTRRTCTNNGGMMPEPRSEQENKFLTNNFTIKGFWLGAVRSDSDKLTFVWLSDGTEVNYTKWHTSEPSTGHDCVHSRFDAGNWKTLSCDELCTNLVYCDMVCQKRDKCGKCSCYFASIKSIINYPTVCGLVCDRIPPKWSLQS